ncbi:fibronectin type III domain-containing protein [Butyrivibrio sp. AE3004]|uniref:fibronectin type III domain-containing protein n=1 Tax=Butyrivibrio sp. AE3004 TaxID=1506994 RepID=UPI000494A73A|nr:fibronectin type III domain-containing protein [Butyrivibrio sp. AE3004]
MKNIKKSLPKLLFLLSVVILLILSCNTTSLAASNFKLRKPQITDITKTKNSITVEWSQVEDATGYKIYISDNKSKDKCIATVNDPNVTSYKIKGLKSGTKYKLKVKAYKKGKEKNTFSASSPSKNAKTEFGLVKGHFSCKKFSISWNSSQWKPEEVYSNLNQISLHTKDSRYLDRGYLYIDTVEPAYNVKGKGLDKYVAWYIKYDNSNIHSHKYKRLANRKIDGKTFAVLYATNTSYGKNNTTLLYNDNDEILEICYSVPDNATHPERKMEQIRDLLSTIKINKK